MGLSLGIPELRDSWFIVLGIYLGDLFVLCDTWIHGFTVPVCFWGTALKTRSGILVCAVLKPLDQ